MLKLNLISLLESRGVENPQRYLSGKGLPYYTVSRLVNNKLDKIPLATLEKLCMICNCTPDELFVWEPDAATTATADHPLQKLKAKPKKANPVDRIKKLPLEKIEQLQQFIDELEKK
ncbi:MAG TPA: helix-turn-helix transcriptional regulator [Chitinophagaceae bacterium]|nr:helix-turn-helix transcriptional regulator [Chitinophagaceae bacterium]